MSTAQALGLLAVYCLCLGGPVAAGLYRGRAKYPYRREYRAVRRAQRTGLPLSVLIGGGQ